MIPQDFSYELPARCLALLDDLEEKVPDMDGSSLRTTFLLSMAMPLLTIPDQVLSGHKKQVMRGVNQLRRQCAEVMEGPFGKAPFRIADGDDRDFWFYLQLPQKPRHPHELEQIGHGLRHKDYVEPANQLPTAFVIGQLRNALAHGGVIYLDGEGLYRPDTEARMLAFIAEEWGDEKPFPYTVLGVMEADFSAFLRKWATWLGEQGINQPALAA